MNTYVMPLVVLELTGYGNKQFKKRFKIEETKSWKVLRTFKINKMFWRKPHEMLSKGYGDTREKRPTCLKTEDAH